MWANAQRDGRPAEYRGALCSTPQFGWRTLLECSAKTRNPLKLTRVPQTNETISAASGPKFTILLCGHVEEILLLNKFFPIVDTCLSCEDIARHSCGMVPRWRFLATFLGPAFAASRVQHLLDLHSKFALGPHHVSKYMVDIQPAASEIRRGKKKNIEEDRRMKPQGKNIMACPIT